MAHEYFGDRQPSSKGGGARSTEEMIEDALRPVAAAVGLGGDLLADGVARDLTRRTAKAAFDFLESTGIRPQSMRILDLGAGLGQTSVEAVARGGDPVAVEPGVAWCAVVAARLAETGHDGAVVANGEQLPFPDRTFDLVMSVAVLEHVRRPEVYLREAFRVLRPGGHMYLSCENYLTFFEPHYQVAWLPLFPKSLASLYLKARGRPVEFLHHSITYTTRPWVNRMIRRVGFRFVRELDLRGRLDAATNVGGGGPRVVLQALRRFLPSHVLARVIVAVENLRYSFVPYYVTVVQKPRS